MEWIPLFFERVLLLKFLSHSPWRLSSLKNQSFTRDFACCKPRRDAKKKKKKKKYKKI